jgi:Prohead core protein serine protease
MALLITETNDFEDTRIITEGSGKDKKYYIQGPCAVAETVNRNKRVYPAHVLEREINRYDRDNIRENTAYGELTHPPTATIDPNNVSHRFISVKRRGNVWEGKAIVVNTPKGNILRGLLESGGKMGISTRGVGSLHESRGHKIVGDDYRIVTLGDIVTDPSAPGAWANGILENYDFQMNQATGEFERQHIEQVHNRLKRTRVVNLTEEEKARMFADFCRLVKQN